MTLNGQLGSILRGEHVMGEDGLRDYHKIQAVKNAMRVRDRFVRFNHIKAVLHPYHVTVSLLEDERVRVWAPAKQTEVIL